MPKKEPSLLRIAAVLMLISIGLVALKLGVPQAIFQVGFNYLSDGMMNVGKDR